PELPARPFPAEELEALCRAALAPDPAARPTAAAVAHAVADWLDESRRRERLAAVDATILGVRQALFDDHRTLLRASFYARMGGVELESVPHQWWLQRRIAELQRAARLGADAAALTPLLSALQAQDATIQAALLSLHEAEGEFGAEDGLSAPLATLREALKAQGLPDADPWI
ncbi:hypothetical protein L6R46_13115, partial [Myxococcota bacterium]|nr:hypothetical protein [Myxococcota bacterium]